MNAKFSTKNKTIIYANGLKYSSFEDKFQYF